MTHGPLHGELLLDSVKKDLSIDNLQKLLNDWRDLALKWVPQIEIDNDANNGNSIQFKLIVGDPSKPADVQGLTYTLSKDDVLYLSDGNSLAEDVADNLSTLYESLLRNVIREKTRFIAANIRKERSK